MKMGGNGFEVECLGRGKAGGLREAARKAGIPQSTARDVLKKLRGNEQTRSLSPKRERKQGDAMSMTHTITVSPHIRPDGSKHPNAFDARLDGSDALLCTSETPLFDACRVLLKTGAAQPDDVIVMRHAGAQHDALRAKVGVAAGLTISDKPSGRRIHLEKYRGGQVPEPPGIEQTPSLAPSTLPVQENA